MPHLILEYSANLEGAVDVPVLVQRLHEAAIATGAFPPAALRTRAERREVYVIGDGGARNAFVAVLGRMAPGRPDTVRHELAGALFAALQVELAPAHAVLRLSVTVDLQEIDAHASFRHIAA